MFCTEVRIVFHPKGIDFKPFEWRQEKGGRILRETHPPCWCFQKAIKSRLLHKNFLLVDNVDTSWKTIESITHLLSVEVVNLNIIVCGVAH